MLRRITLVVCLLIMHTVLVLPVNAQSGNEISIAKIAADPANVRFYGANLGEKRSATFYFDLSALPRDIELQSATLNYLQTGASSGFMRISNRADNTLILTKPINAEGVLSIKDLLGTVSAWYSSGNNLGLFVEMVDMDPNKAITFESIDLTIAYKFADYVAPQIVKTSVLNTGFYQAEIAVESSEIVDVIIEYGKTSRYGSSVSTTTSALSSTLLLSDLNPGISYHYKVTVTDLAGNQSSSDDMIFSTSVEAGNVLGEQIADPSSLAAPTELNVEVERIFGRARAVLIWTASASQDIDGYKIFRKGTDDADFRLLSEVTRDVLTFTDESVEEGVKYTYFIRTTNTASSSVRSPEVSSFIPLVQKESQSVKFSRQAQLLITLAAVGCTAIVLYFCYKTIKRIIFGSYSPSIKRSSQYNILKDPDFYTKED